MTRVFVPEPTTAYRLLLGTRGRVEAAAPGADATDGEIRQFVADSLLAGWSSRRAAPRRPRAASQRRIVVSCLLSGPRPAGVQCFSTLGKPNLHAQPPFGPKKHWSFARAHVFMTFG